MSDKNEVERLKRLREKQLSARDPNAYERKVQGEIARKANTARKKQNFWKDSAKGLSRTLWGAAIGAVLGLIVLLVLGILMPGDLGGMLGIVAILILAVIGALIGGSFEWREEMRRTIK